MENNNKKNNDGYTYSVLASVMTVAYKAKSSGTVAATYEFKHPQYTKSIENEANRIKKENLAIDATLDVINREIYINALTMNCKSEHQVISDKIKELLELRSLMIKHFKP